MSGGHNGLGRFFVVPHTHWDREWYRPLEYFRLELGDVVDGVLDVLERDRDFASFTLHGQAVVLEDYVALRPDNEGRLRALLEEGRLEVGPSYVLPDEFLVGAEALVRNLLIGRAVCERFGTEPSPVGYLPDSFGHPRQLPQILAGFGIESFVFSRGLGDEFDWLGAVFRWQAPDGSEVLAFQELPDYSNFAAVSDADDAEARIRGIVERFGPALEHGGVNSLLLCNGSDHFPVQAELPRLWTELEQRFPGVEVRIARARARGCASRLAPAAERLIAAGLLEDNGGVLRPMQRTEATFEATPDRATADKGPLRRSLPPGQKEPGASPPADATARSRPRRAFAGHGRGRGVSRIAVVGRRLP